MTVVDFTATSLGRRTVLAAAIALIGLAGAASAHAQSEPVDLRVVDRDTGQPMRVWRHDGRLFIAGEPGRRYSLRVTNHTDGRVLVVLSVDGVNILSGETASYDQRGYVFDPYESYDVTGWRKSNTQVAAFAFAPLPQSYAARTGRPTEVGVIGMAVFEEKAPPPPEPEAMAPHWRDDAEDGASGAADGPVARRALPAAPALTGAQPSPASPSSKAAAQSELARGGLARRPDEKLGTAHGAREWSVVSTTTFERATSYPQSVRQIEYDTYANLVARGVIPPPDRQPHRPRPFPLSPGGEGFVPDPPG